jgi:hypothetical protein
MPVSGSDLHFYLSSGGASEGGARSATEIVSATDNNVFPDVGDVARIAGGSMTRKIFVANEHGVDAYAAHSIWILLQPTNAEGSIGLGFDDADDDEPDQATLVDFSASAKVALISDGADTRSVDIWGELAGTPKVETVVLTGASEVLSATNFDKVYAVHTTISASRTITIKQGPGGTTRGTIPVGAVNCFRWLTPATAKSTGIRLPSLATGQANGLWELVEWDPDAAAIDASDFAIKTEAL